jgi:two-component system, OmpR family, sensor kinase
MRALHARLTIAFALLLAALAIGLLLLLSRTSDRYSDEVLQRLNAGIAMYVVQELPLLEGGKVNEAALHELAHRTMTVNPSAEVYLLDPFGRVLSTAIAPNRIRQVSVRLEPIEAFLRFPERRPLYGDDPTSLHARRVFSVAAIQSGGQLQGYLYVVLGGQPAQSIDAQLRGSYTLRAASAALAVVLAGTLLIAGVLFTALTRRLRELDHRMHAWAMELPATALGLTAPTAPADEISALADRFRTMSEAIERQIRDLKATDELRRELIANVSHDLRTPLACLRGYIETALVKHVARSEGDLRAHLSVALQQTDQLGRLIDALFELAKLESGTVTPKLEPFVVAELLQDVALRFRIRAQERGIELHTLLDIESVLAVADIELLERVMGNLLENALRYTPAGGHVRMEMSVEPALVRVRVIDTGSGIEPRHLSRVFDRFYSAPHHSDRDRAGLGLAIVKRIIDLHGQSVRILSGAGTGTTVEFTLKRAATGAAPTERSSDRYHVPGRDRVTGS